MWTITNSTKLIDKMNSKQDLLTAWDYIRIENNKIDATYEFWQWLSTGTTEYDTKWPCPSWFHIPTVTEVMILVDVLDSLNITTNKHRYYKMPKAWCLSPDDDTPPTTYAKVGVGSYFKIATVNLDWNDWWYYLDHNFTDPYQSTPASRSLWITIRPFKNDPVLPDSTWTVLAWSLSWVWIFWNAELWLITCTADWTNYTTIADKNLWATETWTWWESETPEKCWLYYQYWNNHWFDWTETSSTTLVDASGFWPGNYYDSSTFIVTTWDWDSNANFEQFDTRRWVSTQWTHFESASVTNSWVLSVNGQNWDVTINPVAMVTLEYWTSTWAEFLEAYNAKSIVYCKVWSSNPQWYRMAFLAYVAYSNWEPSEAEFQYLRSVGSKTSSQPCDQVFIYKLMKSTWAWTTTTRNVAQKDEAWDWISITFTNWASPKETFTNTAIQVSWVQPTAPTWYLWYDTINEVLKVYDGVQWKTLAYAV